VEHLGPALRRRCRRPRRRARLGLGAATGQWRRHSGRRLPLRQGGQEGGLPM